ncbi:class I SAM-dependent methyltransferase [Bosea rubneri]|uniref:Methyltransferase domain-containing protein n=1 Tax=Bosea rubneri TaxID=3075434 RepID=A0ABU3SH36_9HYPH|nr:methyltransferase domain-containing protein [Bosea sp. ZW T0_25]MDU0344001.1 methyltransferase domain-containing protein [Bosea sp. ZW T0_25]
MSDHATYRLTKHASLSDLVSEYRREDGLIDIDLGCGYYKPDGFIGLDNLSATESQIDTGRLPDIMMDLNVDDLPFGDGVCNEVRSSHFLEHSNLSHIFAQSHRVLKSEGTFRFTVPYANSAEGMYPGHAIFLTEKWFQENIQFNELFKIISITYTPSKEYECLPIYMKKLFPFEIARVHLFNSCREMTMITTRKE